MKDTPTPALAEASIVVITKGPSQATRSLSPERSSCAAAVLLTTMLFIRDCMHEYNSMGAWRKQNACKHVSVDSSNRRYNYIK